MKTIVINGSDLKLADFVAVARFGAKVELAPESKDKILAARKIVDDYVDAEKIVYGITTGFGKFSDVFISKKDTKQLQKNLIMSHSCGVGNPLSKEEARGIMLLRANAVIKGNSGVKLETVMQLINCLNADVYPLIPEKGSLGASGDLAPLSHMVLVLLGLGRAFVDGVEVSGAEALAKAGLEPIELTSKEGLALINGTQVMTSIGALATYDALNLLKIAQVAGAMTMEALNGITDAYNEKIHLARGQAGQIKIAGNMLKLVEGSNMTTKQGELRVQDSYSLRCFPQITGASKDAIEYVLDKVAIEMNAATDNPLIFSSEEVYSGGNFHGQPMALAFDFLGIAVSELANSSERRLERLVNPALSEGLPAFLVANGGLNSGFMIVQYSAASLVSENKVLAHPASVDSIPSSANQEDHVSMGTIAARKARDIVKNAKAVLAMELLASCQAVDLRGNKGLGIGTSAAYNRVRQDVALIEDDCEMYVEINKMIKLIESEAILNAVSEAVGEL